MAYDIHNLTRHPNPAIPPFSLMDPTIGLLQGAHEEASVEISTGGWMFPSTMPVPTPVQHL